MKTVAKCKIINTIPKVSFRLSEVYSAGTTGSVTGKTVQIINLAEAVRKASPHQYWPYELRTVTALQ